MGSPLFLLISLGIGVIGYKEAQRHEEKFGRGPAGLSPSFWGVICFLLGIIGALALAISEKREKAPDLRPDLPAGVGGRAKPATEVRGADATAPKPRQFTL